MTTTVHIDTDTGEVTTADGEHITNLQDGDEGELFDTKPYDIPVPKMDGHRADTLKVAFGGAVELDILNADDLNDFKGMKLGQEIELIVTATVGKKVWALKTDSEGDGTATASVSLAVHSYRPLDAS